LFFPHILLIILQKYNQIKTIWTNMHENAVDGEVNAPTNFFDGFANGPIGKGMVGNVFHLVATSSATTATTSTTATNGAATIVHHYAAKSMRKEDIVAKSAGALQVLEEMEAMKLMEHPFIIQLYCTWQTASDLVILLDYMPGGELFMVIRKSGSGMFPHLEPYSVRFYAACVLSALTYLHNEIGYVYRDLKGKGLFVCVLFCVFCACSGTGTQSIR
jgi:serine/threonine protein kinase